jgi:hypothetical protein
MFQDGLMFEVMYQHEIACFASAKTGVPGDDVEAALILRRAGKMSVLRLLHQGAIHVIGEVDVIEDRVGDLQFTAA